MAVSKNLIRRGFSEDKDKYQITETWLAISESADGPTDVRDEFADIYDTGYTTLALKTISAESSEVLADGGQKWIVTLVYDSSVPDSSSPDPTDNDPIYNYSYEDVEEIVDFDTDDERVVNRLGEAFDPPLYRTVSYPVEEVKVNLSSVSFATMFALNNSTNSDTFHGAAPHTLRAKVSAQEAKDQDGNTYYQVTYKFIYRSKGWDANIPNMSLNGVDGWAGDSDRWEGIGRIIDDAGEFVAEPQFLNSDNKPLPKPVDPGDIDVLTFEIYPEVSFASATGL